MSEYINRDNREHKEGVKVRNYIKVGMSTCGIAAGAEDVFQAMLKEVKKRNVNIEVKKCGCFGMCYAEPLVEVSVEGMPLVSYGRVTPEIAIEIVQRHLVEKTMVNDYIFQVNT
jgi:(2Fe-2S) ferredoxin